MNAPSPRPPAAADAAPRRRRVPAMARMELRLLLRNGENLLVTFAIPLGALLVTAAVPELPAGGAPVVGLVAATLAVAVFASAFVAMPISTAFAREAGVLKRLGVTPLSRGELIAAKLAALALVVAAQVAAVAVVGVAVGWRPALTPAATAGTALVLALLAVGGAGLGLALAGRLPPLRTLAITNAVFVLALLTSGLAVPLEELPTWLAAPSLLLPVAPAALLLRGLLESDPVAAVGPALAVPLIAWALLAPLVAARVFRWWDE